MLCRRGTRLRWERTRFRGRNEPPGHQLGKCGHLRAVLGLTWANGRLVLPLGSAAFTVIPHCSPLDLVRLWYAPSSPSLGTIYRF
jgi:hypothetical protein